MPSAERVGPSRRRSVRPTVSSHRSSPFTSVRYAERRRRGSGLRAVGVLLALLLLLAVIAVGGLWVYAATSLSGVPVTELARTDDQAQNTLVVLREADGSAGSVAIVQTSPLRPRPAVLVFPADLKVQLLGEGTRPLGDFLTDGGIGQLVDAVQRFTDDGDGNVIGLDHFVLVDLPRFGELVTALGGVPDCAEPTVDEVCGRSAPARVMEVVSPSGTSADDEPAHVLEVLGVVRNTLAELDAQTSPLRPLRTKRLIDAYVAAVETDRDLGPGSFDELAMSVVATSAVAVDVRVIPGVREEGAVRAEPEQAQTLFAAFADPSQPLPADTGITAPVELGPADVSVLVLNGTGVAGLAGEVAGFLTDKGFVIEDTDNAESFDPTSATVVEHGPGGQERAALVAGYFPGATVREVESPTTAADVTVIVGGDWSSA